MMTSVQSTAKHTLATKIFHHLGLLMMIALWVLVEFRDMIGNNALAWHKALGVVFLFWTIARLVNALVRKRLPEPTQPKWQIGLAHFTHFALYVCMLAMPITGILMSVYGGRPVSVFGLFEIPVFVTASREASRFYNELHGDLVFPILMGLIVAHVGAALYHQFILKDNLLSRMR